MQKHHNIVFTQPRNSPPSRNIPLESISSSTESNSSEMDYSTNFFNNSNKILTPSLRGYPSIFDEGRKYKIANGSTSSSHAFSPFRLSNANLLDKSSATIDSSVGFKVSSKVEDRVGFEPKFKGEEINLRLLLKYWRELPYAEPDLRLCVKGSSSVFSSRNRYKKYPAVDSSLVELPKGEYINANLVNVGVGKVIATQHPLSNTVYDFWSMIWEYKVTNVFGIFDDLNEKTSYFGLDVNGKKLVPYPRLGYAYSFTIETKSVEKTYNGIKRYVLEVTYDKLVKISRREIRVNVITTWKCMCIPSTRLVENILNSVQTQWKDTLFPIVVHCNAGLGRTGTLLGVMKGLWDRSFPRDNIYTYTYDICKYIRERRHSAVMNFEQFIFIADYIASRYVV